MTPSLRDQEVLVTGGAGLIGSHIAELLVADGARVRILDNLMRGRRENLDAVRAKGDFLFIQGDIRDREAVMRAMTGCDYVFHQAGVRITFCADRLSWMIWA